MRIWRFAVNNNEKRLTLSEKVAIAKNTASFQLHCMCWGLALVNSAWMFLLFKFKPLLSKDFGMIIGDHVMRIKDWSRVLNGWHGLIFFSRYFQKLESRFCMFISRKTDKKVEYYKNEIFILNSIFNVCAREKLSCSLTPSYFAYWSFVFFHDKI